MLELLFTKSFHMTSGNPSDYKPQESLPDARLALLKVEELHYPVILTVEIQSVQNLLDN